MQHGRQGLETHDKPHIRSPKKTWRYVSSLPPLYAFCHISDSIKAREGRYDGRDTIADGGGQDTLVLEDVRSDQLWFTQMGNDLALNVLGTQDTILVRNWYGSGTQFHLEQIKTSDGKTLLDGQVHNLVQAMSAFAPPASGQTTLPAGYRSALDPVLAANWH
jgi:hypothetical protein